MRTKPIFRFAPSPNGHLHLGHAYSALLNQKLARENEGKLLLRIENIDTARCTRELEIQMLSDLKWLGIEWDDNPIRQSERFDIYGDALTDLRTMGLLYPAFMSRKEVARFIGKHSAWPNDPDGSPHYPAEDKKLSPPAVDALKAKNIPFAERMDIVAATNITGSKVDWKEFNPKDLGKIKTKYGSPDDWGDVVLLRKDTPTSYHISCVLDDALQGVTHIVRGMDLYEATSIHRLLQKLLNLPQPAYHHHQLILDDAGAKLSKSRNDIALNKLKANGVTPAKVREMLGF